jgi:hypothetical protein
MVDTESTNPALRPLERRVLRLVDEGVATSEIARRFRRSPEFVDRVVDYAGLPRTATPAPPAGSAAESTPLRPVERRILKWRDRGTNHEEIGRRFRRSAAHVARVEVLARYKLSAS